MSLAAQCQRSWPQVAPRGPPAPPAPPAVCRRLERAVVWLLALMCVWFVSGRSGFRLRVARFPPGASSRHPIVSGLGLLRRSHLNQVTVRQLTRDTGTEPCDDLPVDVDVGGGAAEGGSRWERLPLGHGGGSRQKRGSGRGRGRCPRT